MYTDSDHGLVNIADSLGLKLLPPRKKITIMLIGKKIKTLNNINNSLNLTTWLPTAYAIDFNQSNLSYGFFIYLVFPGNHSAGKSSFINWYIEEHVQRTGVAIETQGFSFVTSGKKRESLTGNATLHLYPHFKPLAQMPNLVDYLSTEISTSKQKKFPLVTFVDTPGLVDGDMCYPFDVNESILWLSDLCDLVFVFFDPIGQVNQPF